jgi:hypothetical protein
MKLLEPHEHLVHPKSEFRRIKLLSYGGLAALVGVVVLVRVFAAGTPVAFEAESGTLAGGAAVASVTGQSGSGTVKFAAGGTAGTLNLPRVGWEGGSAYWSKFPKAVAAGWTNPSFFPIGVFLGKPEHAAALKNVGVNTYYGAEHDGSTIASMTGQGMYVMPQDEWTPAQVGSDPKVPGWFISDECDIGLGCTGSDAAANLVDQTNKVNAVHALNDGRFTAANYSNGILNSYWAQGSMAGLMSVVDAASNDKYMYTSSFVQGQVQNSPAWPAGANPATSGAYGWMIDQMRAYQSPAGVHPNWVFVEAAVPFLNETDSVIIKPEQLEGAIWSSIIHEARGVMYFQHNNSQDLAQYHPSEPVYANCGEYSLVDCDATRLAQIKVINNTVTSFAPIINTQSYVWSFNTTTNTMLKTYSGSAYIFADIGLKQTPGSKTFTLPPGISGTTVTVMGENRTLPVTNGAFTDTFAAEYTHHIYQITL